MLLMCLAVPGQLLDFQGEGLERRGTVSFGGVRKLVSLACLPEAVPGDFVLVHAGLAIGRIDPGAAERVFAYLEQVDGL